MVSRLTRIVIALAVIAGAVFLWRTLLMTVAAIALLVIAALGYDRWRKWRALHRFRAAWQAKGRDLLLVYSNSPNWQRYVEETWLPRWGQRAVVLNWSERSQWRRPLPAEVALFRAFAGAREFNPIGIVVPATGRHVHIVRFRHAFRDYKHGKDRLLREAEAELDRWLP
jgi:hypothetical protein